METTSLHIISPLQGRQPIINGEAFSAEGVLCFSAIPLRKTASKKPIYQNEVKRTYNNFTALVVYIN
jgi:hypothetical protein